MLPSCLEKKILVLTDSLILEPLPLRRLFWPVCFRPGIFFYPLVLSYLVTHSSGFVVKLCIKVNVKTRKMCNLQGVSFYSLLQWRLSTTVSQPRLRSAWKLMCSAGPYQASLPHSPLPFSSSPMASPLIHTLFILLLLFSSWADPG